MGVWLACVFGNYDDILRLFAVLIVVLMSLCFLNALIQLVSTKYPFVKC